MSKERYEVMKSMHTIVQNLNNEGAYFDNWIYEIPDEATDDDLRDIAEDDQSFADAVKCFKGIMRDYLDDGIYVDGKLY